MGAISNARIFFGQFLANPLMLGSVTPSSQTCVKRLLRDVEWAKTKVFVEYGPGPGNFSRYILDMLPADAVLVVVELNPRFSALLREEIKDPRLKVIEGSADDINQHLTDLGLPKADVVLSGIPFSAMPAALRESIVAQTAKATRVGGSLLIYQYSLQMKPVITRHFEWLRDELEWLNVPPCRLMFCRKGNQPPK